MKRSVFIFSFIFISMIFGGCSLQKNTASKEKSGYRQVNAETAKELMDNETDYIILDVRTTEEYDEKHIPGALLIPDYEITERAEKELPDKDQLILVYCRSGNRSKTASQALADMGYTNIVEFGGIKSWPYETEK